MYQTPEEVPAPQIQTRFEQGEAYQQRYGLAFKMEHGFQRTEMGRQAYAMNLAIITQAVRPLFVSFWHPIFSLLTKPPKNKGPPHRLCSCHASFGTEPKLARRHRRQDLSQCHGPGS